MTAGSRGDKRKLIIFAPPCHMFKKKRRCAWHLFTYQHRRVGVSRVTARDWGRWRGKWLRSTSSSWPWSTPSTGSWRSRETVRTRSTWEPLIQPLGQLEYGVCVRVGPPGRSPVWAELHNTPGESTGGAERAGAEEWGDAAAAHRSSPSLTVSHCSQLPKWNNQYNQLSIFLTHSILNQCPQSNPGRSIEYM